MRWKVGGGRPLVCLLAHVLTVTSCARPLSTPSSREIRVLVYNVHAGKDAAGADNLARVAELVRETGADIALLQEIDRGTRRSGQVDQPDVLARHTGFAVAFGKTLDYDGGEYGIAVLSRWPIAQGTMMRLRVDPPQRRSGGSYEPRGAQRVTVRAPAGDLVVINTHLDASREDLYRRQEVRPVLMLARDAGSRVLVGGDFNSTPESEVQADVRSGGLRDAWLACGTGDGFTYPADTPTKRIDYLYLSGTATCVRAEVVGTTASDHRALLVRVTLR
jgi:endonuclease/exonuclease/phosphatase family metal-dependent hydrolase